MRPVSDGVSQLKTVMITGVSTGIGKACAVRLAREGFRVYGSCLLYTSDAADE